MRKVVAESFRTSSCRQWAAGTLVAALLLASLPAAAQTPLDPQALQVLLADGDTTYLPTQANGSLEDETPQAGSASEQTAKFPTTTLPEDNTMPAQDAAGATPPVSQGAPAPASSTVTAKPATQTNATPAPVAEALPQPGAIPMPTIGWHSYFKALGGLCLILALVFGGLYFLRKVLPRTALGGAKGRQLTLESALSLGPRKSLMVVRFLNKQLVLGVTDTRITCLHIQEDEHEPDDADSDTPNGDVLKNFADRLKDHL